MTLTILPTEAPPALAVWAQPQHNGDTHTPERIAATLAQEVPGGTAAPLLSIPTTDDARETALYLSRQEGRRGILAHAHRRSAVVNLHAPGWPRYRVPISTTATPHPFGHGPAAA